MRAAEGCGFAPPPGDRSPHRAGQVADLPLRLLRRAPPPVAGGRPTGAPPQVTVTTAAAPTPRPALAHSLNILGDCPAAMVRTEKALPAYEEALRTLLPFYLASPAAFADRIDYMMRNYVNACRTLGREPDAGLLGQARGERDEARGERSEARGVRREE